MDSNHSNKFMCGTTFLYKSVTQRSHWGTMCTPTGASPRKDGGDSFVVNSEPQSINSNRDEKKRKRRRSKAIALVATMEDVAAGLSVRNTAWSTKEFELLVQAWEAAAAELRSASGSVDDVGVAIYHHFQGLQGGRPARKPRAVAAKCTALRSSFLLVEGFDAHQRQVGGRLFFELHYLQKQEVMRSWRRRNAAVIELTAKMYAGLTRVFKVYKENAAMMRQLDNQDERGAEAGRAASAAPRGKQSKSSTVKRSASDDAEKVSRPAAKSTSKSASKPESKPAAKVASKPPSKPTLASEPMVVRMRSSPPLPSSLTKSSASSEAVAALEKGADAPNRRESQKEYRSATSGTSSARATASGNKADTQQQRGSQKGDSSTASEATPSAGSGATSGQTRKDKERNASSAASGSSTETENADENELEEKHDTPQQSSSRPTDATPATDNKLPPPEQLGDTTIREPRSMVGGGRRQWSDEELKLSVKAWENAVTKMLQRVDSLSVPLPNEVHREFANLQGGHPTRNRSALMSKRSALKFSSMHINEYNKQQERKGGPRFSALPAAKRASIMKTWQNANALDISESMLADVTRIKALEERVKENDKRLREEARNNSAEADESDGAAADVEDTTPTTPKIPVWSQEESWDLVRVCAEVADSGADGSKLSPMDREARIYDLFKAARAKTADGEDATRHMRSLKELGRQWQCILTSFNYIKTYNDGLRDEALWFDLTPIQKRAYERCTVPPRKFVDLDSEMFALIQRTSFPLNSAATNDDSSAVDPLTTESADASNARAAGGGGDDDHENKRKKSPRTEKEVPAKDKAGASTTAADTAGASATKTKSSMKGVARTGDAGTSPQPSASSKVTPDGAGTSKSRAPLKNNAWTDEEVASLLKAWKYATQFEDAMNITALSKPAFKRFSALEGASLRRSAPAMRAKMNSIKNLYTRIKEYDAARRRSNQLVWIDQPEDERLELLREWRSGAHLELTKDMYVEVEALMERPGKASAVSKSPSSSKATGKKKAVAAEKVDSDCDAEADVEDDDDEDDADDDVKNLVGPHAAVVAPVATPKASSAAASAKRKRSDTKPSPSAKAKARAKQPTASTGKSDRPATSTTNKQKKHVSKGQSWTKRELLLLARACAGLLKDRPTGQYLSEEQKQALFERYRELGGTRPMQAAVTRARNMIDSYDFIRSFDKNAASNQWPRWFELDVSERRMIMASVCNVHTNLNGLADMDDDLLGFISRMDAAAQPKDQPAVTVPKPKKVVVKKSRKRASSGSSPVVDRVVKARYGDPEDAAAIARDILRQKHGQGLTFAPHTGKNKANRQSSSIHDNEHSDASSSRLSQSSSDSDSDNAGENERRIHQRPASDDEEDYSSSSSHSRARHSKVRKIYATAAQRQRVYGSSRSVNDAELPPSSAFIVDLIQKQNEQFEVLLERFRRDRANDRKQFFDSIYAAIQARLPADNGSASHIERLVERQGRSLSDMLQRLQSNSGRYPRAPDWTRDPDRADQAADWNRGAGLGWARDQSRNGDWGRYRDWERDGTPNDWNRRREWDWSAGREWERDRETPWYGDQSVDRPSNAEGAPGRDDEQNCDVVRDASRYADRVVFPPDQSRW